ncbi:MAG: DNA internalization-related competence protein ComEC/Rec2 [Chloroflexi bacterium]|nr:DNA internalization-related competence protein ComEC/Rec2 [Chloroflexota bacterium]
MPLAWLALGVVLGLFAGSVWEPPPLALLLLLVAMGGAWALARSAGVGVGLLLLVAAGVLIGVLRGGPGVLEPREFDALERFHGEVVELRGTLNGVAELVGTRVRFRLEAEAVRGKGTWRPSSGAVRVWADAAIAPLDGRGYPFLAHGDLVMLRGVLDAPQPIGGFDYREHLAARGIGSELTRASVIAVEPADGGGVLGAVHAVRAKLADAIERHVPEPQAALTRALVLGMRGSVPPRVSQEFRDAGLAHLLAVSGMHVGVVLGLSLLASASVFGRRRGLYLIAPFVLLWVYVALAGAPPSAVRAGAMGSAYLLALAAGRLTAPLNALGLAALVLLAWDPAALWDRSFQLSFTAMLGVLVIGLPLWRRAQERLPSVRPAEPGIRALGVRLGRAVAGGVLVSAGAVIGSLPLVALNFGQVPLLGILATLIALPVLPLLLVAGVVTALVSSLAPLLADATGLVVAAAGGLIVLDAAVVSRVPGSVVQAGFVTAGWAWASYAVMFAALAVLNRGRWAEAARGLAAALWRGPSRRVEAWAVVAALAVLAGTLWLGVASRPDGLLHVSFLDVGQGDATLLVTPGGAVVLIDGGADPRVTIPLLDAVLGPGRRRIDVAFLTHPHRDHMGSLLELARRGRIERLIVPPVVAGEDDAWRRELDALEVSVHEGGAGMTVTFTDGVTVEVLNPPSPPLVGTASDLDNNGLVLRARIKDAAVLFTGDLYEDGERLLVDRGAELTAGVLKLGHHGSDRASGTALLRAVAPSIAVVSAGAENPLGHVSPRVLERLGAPVADGRTFLTSRHGTIELTTDGSTWWVVTERD